MAQEFAGLSVEDAKRLLAHLDEVSASGLLSLIQGRSFRNQSNVRPHKPIFVENASGQIIPRFACMQVIGTNQIADQCYLVVDQPKDDTADAGGYVFNGPTAIAATANSYGRAYDGPHVDARLDQFEPPTTRLAPKPGTWELTAKTDGQYINAGPNNASLWAAEEIYRVLVYDPDPKSNTPWVRFTSTTPMANEQMTVRIDLINGQIDNPANPGTSLVVGDETTVYDPNNLFQNAHFFATGVAYLRTPQNSNNFPPAGAPPNGSPRLEIEHCTLPIDYITGVIDECLYYNTVTIAVKFGAAQLVPDWVLSDWPNVDFPPEATVVGQNDYVISTVQNTCKFTAVDGASVRIRRLTDRETSEPNNTSVDTRSQSARWVIDHVCQDKQIARWLYVQKAGSQWNYVAHYEGADPRPCNIPASCLFDCSCMNDGDFAVGFYAPEVNQYWLISTASAMAGELKDVTAITSITGADCGFNWTTQPFKAACLGAPGAGSFTLPTGPVVNGVNLYQFGTRICAQVNFVQGVVCGGGGVATSCVDICPIICLCPGWWDDPNCVPPPPPICNCEDCHFEEGVTAVSVEPGGWSAQAIIPNVSDPCCWSAEFQQGENIDYLEACYGGNGNWTLTGTLPDGTNVSMSGQGDCSGASVSGTGGTGTIVADGVVCEPPSDGCCQTWSGDEVGDALDVNGEGYDITLDGKPPIVAGGPCGASTSGTVTVYDNNADESCNANFTAELRFHADTPAPGSDSCIWHIDIDPCSGALINFPGASLQVEGCLGGSCGTPPSDCGTYTGIWTISDPDASVDTTCNDPAGMAMLESASGEQLQPTTAIRRTARRIAAPSTGLGDEFSRTHPQFVKGCGCKRDIVHVMNRWTRGDVSESQIETLARTIKKKNGGHTLEEITKLLTEFVDAEN